MCELLGVSINGREHPRAHEPPDPPDAPYKPSSRRTSCRKSSEQLAMWWAEQVGTYHLYSTDSNPPGRIVTGGLPSAGGLNVLWGQDSSVD